MLDFIIVGQGLAGSILAWHCVLSGKSFVVVDPDSGHNSSLVAAGLMDPISGQRFFQAWQADRVLPYAKHFYPQIEALCKSSFFHLKPGIRFFQTQAEQDLWEGKKNNPKIRDYFPSGPKRFFEKSLTPPGLGVEVVGSGYLDTPTFLRTSRAYFEKHHRVITDQIRYSDLSIGEAAVHWQGINAKTIVFCEGWAASQNPWFDWLPFNHSKGNILTLEFDTAIPSSHILHRGKWALPLSETRIKCGATYDKDFKDVLPDADQKEALVAEFSHWFTPQFKVAGHQAGIRPIALDNKPIIGPHPVHKVLVLFNTLGSRGVSLGPFYAKQLLDFYTLENRLDSEVRLSRYMKYFPR